MSFQPQVNQELVIDGVTCSIAEHPAVPGIPYGQEGRQAIVYKLVASDGEVQALKVFKPRYRLPAMVGLAEELEPFARLSGLQVCHRSVLSARRHRDLLRQHPDLTYAVLMPWIQGPTWMEVMLQKRALTPETSLALARALAETLVEMEEHGLAHCDLSGPNVLLPGLLPSPEIGKGERPLAVAETCPEPRRGGEGLVALIDVEQLYSSNLKRPELLPGGSPGYAHRTAPDGLWSSVADRFAGAVLLGEVLGWCDARVREAAWGDNYFDPNEMQRDGERYRVLSEVLRERGGDDVARLFQRAWDSETLADCPTFGEWLASLPEQVRQAPEPVSEEPATNAVQVLMDLARQFEEQGKPDSALVAYRQARSFLPARSELAGELALIVQDLASKVPEPGASAPPHPPGTELDPLFHEGMAAYLQEEWARARELLGAVVRRQPDYAWQGLRASALLDRMGKRPPPFWQRVPWWAWMAGMLAVVVLVTVGVLFSRVLLPPRPASTPTPGVGRFEPGHTLRVHQGAVQDVAFSPDGKTLASGSVDGTVLMWKPFSKESLIVLETVDQKPIWSVAFSPDGETLASSTSDKIILWQGRDGGFLGTLERHWVTESGIAFSPDGTTLASAPGSWLTEVALQRVSDGALLYTLKHAATVGSVAFSPDGIVLATGGNDDKIYVWQASDGTPLRDLEGHTGDVRCIAFSPDGAILASGADDQTIRLWQVSDGTLLHTLEGHAGTVKGLAFSPDGEILASGSSDGTVRVWHASDGALLGTLKHPAGVNSVAFAPDRLLLASGAEDGIVRLWAAGDATVSQPAPLQFLARSDMDALFGTGNWFCFPDRDDGVGVRILPGNFAVQPPLLYIDTQAGRYAVGQTFPGLTGATAGLDGRLPGNECPSFQQEALDAWVAARAADAQLLSKARLDDLFGSGNWECLPDHASGIRVKRLSSPLTVQYPCTVVDVSDAKYGVGDVAPGGEGATVWLADPVPRDECP